jgi:hypothetical protein
MSKKYVNEIKPLPQEVVEIEAPTKPKVTFDRWFDKQIKLGKSREWQKDGLWIFMKKQGLSGSEDEDLYNEVFLKF